MAQFFYNSTSTATDRFAMEKLLQFTDNYDPLDSTFLTLLTQLPVAGTKQILTQAGRPDYLSYTIYGDTQYWWILLYYNALQDPDSLLQGMTINYPALTGASSLESLLHSLKAASNI